MNKIMGDRNENKIGDLKQPCRYQKSVMEKICGKDMFKVFRSEY